MDSADIRFYCHGAEIFFQKSKISRSILGHIQAEEAVFMSCGFEEFDLLVIPAIPDNREDLVSRSSIYIAF